MRASGPDQFRHDALERALDLRRINSSQRGPKLKKDKNQSGQRSSEELNRITHEIDQIENELDQAKTQLELLKGRLDRLRRKRRKT